MAILVTGGAGYIGSHATLELLDEGEQVVVLDNLSTGFRWAVPEEATFIVGDFGDSDLVMNTIARYNIHEIIHFAAKTVVPESIDQPLDYYLNNTSKARILIESAIKTGIKRFIFSSTAAVYGEAEAKLIDENERLAPISPYGRSKLMVEWILEDTAKATNLEYVILRYFNVAGADPQGRSGQSTPHATHLIKVAVQAALGSRGGMQIFGTDYPTRDGSCVRDYIHVSDLAHAHLDALRYLRAGGESIVCNAGYQRGYSVLEVIDIVKKISGVNFPVQILGRRAGDPAAIVSSNERIRTRLGWKPQHDDLEKIVGHALEWERRLYGSKIT